jgi:hypothetical protein
MLPSGYSILSVCVYRSARYQRACFISSTLHVYMCHSSSRRADRWCSPTRMQSHYAVQQLRLHNYPVRPAVFTRGQPGRRDSLSQGSRTCCHRRYPPCPAARAGLAGLERLCRASAQLSLLGHLFAFPLRPRPRPQIAFSLWLLATSSGAGTIARGNIHIASSPSSPIYTRQVDDSKTRDPLA